MMTAIDRIQRNSVESNTITTVVDRFKFITEAMNQSDALSINIPVKVFFEKLGVSPYFRFSYDRWDYGRFGDVGGMDDVVGVSVS